MHRAYWFYESTDHFIDQYVSSSKLISPYLIFMKSSVNKSSVSFQQTSQKMNQPESIQSDGISHSN